MYLLDTNILSELRRGARPVVTWMEPVDTADLFVSVVSLGEIQKGFELKAKRDPRGAQPILAWLGQVQLAHRGRILPVTDEIAIAWGRLEAQRPRGPDGLIAATALVGGLTLVTRNDEDFRDIPIALLNPWTVGST